MKQIKRIASDRTRGPRQCYRLLYEHEMIDHGSRYRTIGELYCSAHELVINIDTFGVISCTGDCRRLIDDTLPQQEAALPLAHPSLTLSLSLSVGAQNNNNTACM